ncbi:hypothetical protein RRG08_026021 [Elysia crispata]|uniref:Uncharacterized protein n=1 Tax=Elysia crispata TaxID=231223 RepID=A0AAE1BDA3_9GAST|nr:hypothetical protein RRG08_026021 [Elysia crispata]
MFGSPSSPMMAYMCVSKWGLQKMSEYYLQAVYVQFETTISSGHFHLLLRFSPISGRLVFGKARFQWYGRLVSTRDSFGCSRWPRRLPCLVLPFTLYSAAVAAIMTVESYRSISSAHSAGSSLGMLWKHPRVFTGQFETFHLSSIYIVRLPRRFTGMWPRRMPQLLGATGES